MSTKNRIFYYDALRALAIFGVICIHVTDKFVLKTGLINTNSYYIACFFNCFRSFSIPIFVMLSGALLLNRKIPTITFIKKRFSRVFVPFIIWFIIFSIFAVLFMNTSDIIDIFFGTPGTIGVIFWFIWMILVVYILIFFINKIFSFKDNEKFFSIFVKVAVIAFLIYTIIVTFHLVKLPYIKIVYFASL